MSTDLTVASLTNLPTAKHTVDLTQYGTGGEFLGRLQLVNSQSKYVGLNKIQAGHYGIPGQEDSIEDLGPVVDIIPFAVRDKAMDLSGESPIAVFDPEDPFYQDIVERSSEKDSGCMFGPSFLVFERNSGKFLELYLGNKSGRYEAGKMAAFLPISEEQAAEYGVEPRGPQPCTLTAEFIQRPRQAWYAPKIGKCSTPFDNLPPTEEIVAEVTKFVTEQSSDTVPEVAETATTRSR